MERNKIGKAIENAVLSKGYAFFAGEHYRMDSETGALPAVWMTPLQLVRTKGRTEGVKYYRTTLNLMRQCGEHGQDAKEELWQRMDEDLTQMVYLLTENEDIRDVEGPAYKNGEFALTNRGELSLSAEITVMADFITLIRKPI